MNQNPMPSRRVPLKRGRPMPRGDAGLARRTPLKAVPGTIPAAFAPRATRPRPRRETGFTAAVRLAARVRAGGGDIGQACCEACGKHLGRYGGEIQHRRARGAGGSKSPVINGISNAGLLCGNRYEGCHKLAEDRDPGMEARGWWIRDGRGRDYDPRFVPVTVMTAGGLSMRAYFGEDGTYRTSPPGTVIAA